MHVCGGPDESAVPFCPSDGKMSNRPLMDSAVKCALPTKREETEFPTAALSHGWACEESFFAVQGKYGAQRSSVFFSLQIFCQNQREM